MAQILDLGKLRFNWAGEYSGTVEYSFNDIVTYGANAYVYKSNIATTGNVPTDTVHWTLVVEGIRYRGTYTASTLYLKNDLVTDGTTTFLVVTEHTAANPAVTSPNTALTIFALGQEGLPNQTGQTNKLLATDGSNTSWVSTVKLSKAYIGGAQGIGAENFETTAGLTDVMSAFSGATSDFSQLAIVNTNNGLNASTDFISYTADGTNDSGWIDMGITSNNFSAATYGITGPHDGYVFMSAPRGTTFDIVSKKIVAGVATLTLGATHSYHVGDVLRVEGVGGTLDGLHTVTAVDTTKVSYATTDAPIVETPLLTFGTIYKPAGAGNLVFATDLTGLQNRIVFAAGGFSSGTTQMQIFPNERVHIEIPTQSTSSLTGALVVAGGAGFNGAVSIDGLVRITGSTYVGEDAEAFELAAGLTNASTVISLSGGPYAQVAIQNNTTTASTDVIVYSDNGTDASGWMDMGITGSDFSQSAFGLTGPNDGYVFLEAPEGTTGKGNLVIATGDKGSENKIIIAAGGFATGTEQITITPDVNVHVEIQTPSTSPTTGALTVVGGVGIVGDVNIAGNIVFGGEGTQVGTANLAVEAPMIFTGDGSTSLTNDLGIVTEGIYSITNIPQQKLVNKALTSNVATLTTDLTHNFAVGDQVTVANVDATFNGTFTITAVDAAAKTFSYAKTATNVPSARIGDQTTTITNKVLSSNVATLTTSAVHIYTVGQVVTVTGVDATFNGTYTITAVTGTTFSYAKTAGNVASTAVTPNGSAVVNTSVSTVVVNYAARTRWTTLTKDATDNVWKLVTNLSTKPTTTVDYAQNTYGNGVDVVYDQLKIGGLTIQGSGALYGAPYGSLTMTGNISSPAWTTTGLRYVTIPATFTDTTSTGTVSNAYTSTFGGNTIAATNAGVTYTNYGSVHINGPVAGTNVTITNPYALIAESNVLITGRQDLTGNLNINTNKFNVVASTGNTTVAGTLGVTGDTTFSGNVTIAGRLNVQEMREDIIDGSVSAGSITLDYNTGNIFYIASAPASNYTVALTNVPTDDGKIFTLSIFQIQGSTGYYPTAMTINGSAATIKWGQGLVPTPTNSAGKTDVWNFTIIRRSGAYVVLGNFNFNF